MWYAAPRVAKRPSAVHDLQALIVGQMGLVQVYESAFSEHGLHTAQLLLTREDLFDRKRYLNARSTLTTSRSGGCASHQRETIRSSPAKLSY